MGKLELNSSVQYIKGVGDKMAKYLNKLDICNEKIVKVIGIAISEVKNIRIRNKMTIQKVVFEIQRTEK